MRVEIPVGRLAPQARVSGAVRNRSGTWTHLTTRYNRSSGVATITVPVGRSVQAGRDKAGAAREAGLSWDGVVAAFTDAGRSIKEEQIKPFVNEYFGANIAYSTPTCETASTDRWQVRNTQPGLVVGCVGTRADGSAYVRLVNPKNFVVLIEHSPGVVVSDRSVDGFAAQISSLIGTNLVALGPADTVELTVVPGVAPASIRASVDGFAQSLVAIQVGVDVALQFVAAAKFKAPKDIAELGKAGEVISCITALGIRPGVDADAGTLLRVAKACTTKLLNDAIAGAFMAPVTTAIATGTFLTSSVQSLFVDPFRVQLTYTQPGVPPVQPGAPGEQPSGGGGPDPAEALPAIGALRR